MWKAIRDVSINLFSGFIYDKFNILLSAATLVMLYLMSIKRQKTDDTQVENFINIQQILRKYVRRKGGLDFAACMYKGDLKHDVHKEQLCYRMNHFGVQRTLNEQIDYYLSFAVEIHSIIDKANDRLKELDQGVLFRVVFDVRKGGFFYFHISDGNYIFSATVDQNVMDDNTADAEMHSMVSDIEKFIAKFEGE